MQYSRTFIDNPAVPRLLVALLLLSVLWVTGVQVGSVQAATYTVTKTADTNDGACDADCSLREAITVANTTPSSDTIIFARSPGIQVIQLNSSLPNLNNLTIDGEELNITIRRAASGDYRIFTVPSGARGTLLRLTLTNGRSSAGGGAIFNSGTLTINGCFLKNNISTINGGCILNQGDLTLENTQLTDNSTVDGGLGGGVGAAIQNEIDANLTVIGCIFERNKAISMGGAISNNGTASIMNSTISTNIAINGGGAICNETGGELVIEESTINRNFVMGQGGGILNRGGSINATNCILRNNSAIGGGGISSYPGTGNTPGTLVINQCTFVGNNIEGIGNNGGGIYCNGPLEVVDSIFDSNSATGIFATGGGIFLGGNDGDAAKIKRCAFFENKADMGGGIYNVSNPDKITKLEVTHCIFERNTAQRDGGGIENISTGELNIQYCTFTGNEAKSTTSAGLGGGISIIQSHGSIVVQNCILTDNFAGQGGGISLLNNGTVKLLNNTIGANSAAYQGGGISIIQTTLTLLNNTLYENNSPSGGNIGNNTGRLMIGNTILKKGSQGGNISSNPDYSTVISLGFNLSDDAVSGDNSQNPGGLLNSAGDIRNTDPLLNPLGNNGGPTQTYTLRVGSPAINAGDPYFTPPPDTDQRGEGFPRVRAGRIDIGAFESAFSPIESKISIGDSTVTEGDAGVQNMTFTVTVAPSSAQTVTVDYATANGTTDPASEVSDYTPPNSTLIFAPGETTKTISVPIIGDSLDENDETLLVNLSNAANATITDAQGMGTITDNDPAPNISINDISVTESNGGSAQAIFTLTLSAASGKTITVLANTSSNGGSPIATPGTDYTALTNATITFAPGQTTRPVNVTIIGDVIDENDEKFAVNLSGAVNATIADNAGICTILDNDAPPSISVSGSNITEGNSGTTTMAFTVKLSAASARNITVQYQTANAVTSPATAGVDYQAVPLTLVTFAPGDTTKTVNVTVRADTLDEENERISLNLTTPVNATLGTVTDGVIVDDDATPTLSINDASTAEGNAGTKLLNFTITLSAPSARTITVNVATGNGGSPSATAGVDYQALASILITFAPGDTTKQVSVTINGDTTFEQNEKFGVILSGAVNANLSDNSAIGTITNDDAAPAQSPSA